MMRLGGNDKMNDFIKQRSNGEVDKYTFIPKKYNSPVALLYKERFSTINKLMIIIIGN